MSSMGDGANDAQTELATPSHGARGERARSEADEGAREHAKGSDRMPTIPDGELDDEDRKTEKMSSAHFRALLGLPVQPAISPTVEHEEVASSNLMAEAMEQIRAGAKLRMKSESEPDDDDVVSRLRPSAIPMSDTQRTEITSTAPLRHAIAMAPLARPDEPRLAVPAPVQHDNWVLGALCILIVAAFAVAALLLSR